MSEFEFLEAGVLYLERILDSTINLIAVISGFLVAAHFVGQQMTKAVSVSLSLVYSIFVLIVLTTLVTFTSAYTDVIVQYQAAYPDGWVHPNELRRAPLAVWATFPLVVVWVGSLYYLHFVVRKN
jgi:hypothetical protein